MTMVGPPLATPSCHLLHTAALFFLATIVDVAITHSGTGSEMIVNPGSGYSDYMVVSQLAPAVFVVCHIDNGRDHTTMENCKRMRHNDVPFGRDRWATCHLLSKSADNDFTMSAWELTMNTGFTDLMTVTAMKKPGGTGFAAVLCYRAMAEGAAKGHGKCGAFMPGGVMPIKGPIALDLNPRYTYSISVAAFSNFMQWPATLTMVCAAIRPDSTGSAPACNSWA